MFSFVRFLKGLNISSETDPTKQMNVSVSSGATTGTSTSVVAAQTANRTITLPDATDTLVGKATSDVLTNKSIDADTNTLTNIEDADIKAAAAINATKIANGSVDNTEFQFLDGATSNIQDQIDDVTTNSVVSASNVGSGTGLVFKQKTGANLEFKTLLAGSNISITDNADDITIAASGGGGSSSVFVVYANIIGNQNLASGPVTIDGIVGPPNGSLILVSDQSTTSQNGVYVFNGTGVAMTRAAGWAAAIDFTAGREVFVQNGSFRSGTMWTLTASVTTLNTDPVTFQISGFDPRSFPVVNFVPRVANGSLIGTTSLPFDSVTVGGTDGVQVFNSGTDFLSLRRNAAAGSTFPYTGTQDTLLTAGARAFYLTSLNSTSTATATLGIYTGKGNSGGVNSGAIELVTGTTSTGASGNIQLQPGAVSGGTRGKIQFVDGSEGTAAAQWRSTNTSGSGAWVSPNYAISSDSGSVSTSSASATDITNLSVTITTTGRPVVLKLIAADGTNTGSVQIFDTLSATAQGFIYFVEGSTVLAKLQVYVEHNTGTQCFGVYPGSSFSHFYAPAAGTYTYKVQYSVNAGTNQSIRSAHNKLVAYEL